MNIVLIKWKVVCPGEATNSLTGSALIIMLSKISLRALDRITPAKTICCKVRCS